MIVHFFKFAKLAVYQERQCYIYMTRHVKHFCSIATAFFARSLESVFARSRLLDRDCSKVFLLQVVFARSRLLDRDCSKVFLLDRDCSKVFLLEGVFARKRLLESDCSKVFLLEGIFARSRFVARKHFCFDRDCSKVFLLDRDCSKAIARSRLKSDSILLDQKVLTATDPVEIVI